MFGYVKPFKPELKIREYETYKAVYCGLCGQLGRSYGFMARATLSYDFTFLSMLCAALSEEPTEFESCRCCVNPLKRIKMCVALPGFPEGGSQAFSADIAALMIYYKLLDNIQDSSFLGRIGWGLLRPFAKKAWRKASAVRPDADRAISLSMERQRQVERDENSGIDAACDPTAQVMAYIFVSLSQEEDERRILERMGYLLGRYVYLCDALDDLEEDAKSGNFNPFLRKYGGGEARESLYAEAKRSLNLTTGEFARACDLLELKKFDSIIHNIAHLGLRAGVEEILAKKEKPNDRSV